MLTTYLTGALNENGTPRIGYLWDGSDLPEGSGVLDTGPAKGIVVLEDGTAYDLTPRVIEHAPGHGEQLVQAIQKQLADPA